ncbi:MAG: RES domain-containing protein [Cytophagia bacterium]|nr:MAG: RES domain-containing protein [Cytophagales bacterium]TAG39784.1 MAG: RES domain-containing protein [Cytophagia bacterium]TAG57331.1 MAG: RES domain-containing protein [Runella slithyformis]TAG81426.1 MAG: RES domain-containing protein [Cytophagales bacterium]
MKIYRLTKLKYASDLSGEGAKINGGRWNNEGVACVYAGSTRAICVLEFSVHVGKEDIPKNLSIVEIEVPQNSILKLTLSKLPPNWTEESVSQEIGSMKLSENKYLLIQVPSFIIPSEYNFLINPNHANFQKVIIKSIVDFELDKRIKM